MKQIQEEYESIGRTGSTSGDPVEGGETLWDDPDYIQKVATGTGSVSPEDMLSSGTITSEQYNKWKAKYGG